MKTGGGILWSWGTVAVGGLGGLQLCLRRPVTAQWVKEETPDLCPSQQEHEELWAGQGQALLWRWGSE